MSDVATCATEVILQTLSQLVLLLALVPGHE